MLCEPCPEGSQVRHSKPKGRLGPFRGDLRPNLDRRWEPGMVAQIRYQSTDDTIVQLFISQASVLMTRGGGLQSKSPQPESSGGSVATTQDYEVVASATRDKCLTERSTWYEGIC